MAYPAYQRDPQDDPRDGAVRLWLSHRQWMAVLEDTERKARKPRPADEAPLFNQRQAPRLPAPEDTRCLIRLAQNARHGGTYLVKLRDVSADGLGFYSASRFDAGTRCTVALQDEQGHGLVGSAGVVWCSELEDGLYDVGIRFDKPIDPERFAGDSADSPS